MDPDRVPLFAASALWHLLRGNPEKAEGRLAQIPRAYRGRVAIALEDLSVTLSRLGRRVDQATDEPHLPRVIQVD